jgi:hypothetical protein
MQYQNCKHQQVSDGQKITEAQDESFSLEEGSAETQRNDLFAKGLREYIEKA